jgi:hypothetical protein
MALSGRKVPWGRSGLRVLKGRKELQVSTERNGLPPPEPRLLSSARFPIIISTKPLAMFGRR